MAAEPPHTPPTVDLGLAAISVPANESLLIDIVLVHGLNGTRSTTWTSRQNEFWPSWIVEDFPGARVWVYGYNSSVWLSSSRDHLIVHAIKFLEELASHRVGQRKAGSAQCIPIVMVGHSLGGILIKQVRALPPST
jgi:pimeloyl-ACP methyl ester carboxylesterase